MTMDKKGGWKKFQRLRFDTKTLSRRAYRAETATTRHANKFILTRLKSIREAREYVASWMMVAAILLAAVVFQTVWSQESYSQTVPAAGGTYAEGMLGPVSTLNPLYAQSDAELSAVRLIFSSLYDYDSTGQLRDDIATSMTTNGTNTQYTVKLRKNALWHDGKKVTADDVVFTVNLMKDLDVHALMRSSWMDVSVTALDSHTVRFDLKNPYAVFPQALTCAILPKHILKDIPAGSLAQSTFSISPVGSGPFQLRLLQSGDAAHKIVNLARWDNYYRGKAKLDRFEIHSYEDGAEIVNALKRRDINAAFDFNDSLDKLPTNGFVRDTYKTSGGVYALFNTQNGPLKDKIVRKALQRSVNLESLRDKLSFKPSKLDLPFLPNQVSGVKLPSAPVYDLGAAEQLLKKDGWEKGDDNILRKKNTRLTLHIAYLKDREYSTVAHILAEYWKQLGVDAKLEEFDPAIAIDQSFAQSVLQPRQYDVLINELTIGADPDVFPYWHSSQANPFGLNFSNYKNPTSDDLLLSARLRNEPDLRAKKYAAFAAQWLVDTPAIGLYQSTTIYAHTASTSGTAANTVLPTITDRYNTVLYWTASRDSVYKTP